MRFTKMQGIGNDYVYVDCFVEPMPEDAPGLARAISDRHFGVGADGLILIMPSETADVRMRMFNADGSESEMCGNGIRCVARYAYEHDICRQREMRIETGNGVLTVELQFAANRVEAVRVDMGQPILDAARIPTTLSGSPILDHAIDVGGKVYPFSMVSMGNPHAITFVDEITDDLVERVGPLVERDKVFPNRTNVEFVRVIGRNEVEFRVWERGSGETLACGTGACAVCVAGALSGRTVREVTAHLLGGDLKLEWADDDHVYMTGAAVEVFSGEWPNDSVAVRGGESAACADG